MNKKLWLGMTGLCIMLVLGSVWAFAAVSGDALSYYPLGKPGNKWEYQVTVDGQNAGTQLYGVIQPEGNTMAVGIAVNGKMSAVEYYQESDRGLVRIQEISGKDITQYLPPQLILPAKMEAGKKWNWTSEDGKMKESDTIIDPPGKITVPAGSFDTLLVSCEGIDAKGVSYADKTWFAKGVGMVREENNYGGRLVVLQLIRYQVK